MRNKKFIIFGIVVAASAIATAVSATWAGYKTKEIILKEKPKTKKELVKKVWKYYVPAGVSLGLAIVSDVAVLRIGLKEMAALGATISYLTLNKDKLEKKIRETVGEEQWKQIKSEIDKEMDSHEDFSKLENTFEIQDTGYGKTLCRFSCDYFNIWFRSSPEEALRGIEEIRNRWANHDYIGFIELLDELHIHLKPYMEWLFESWGWPASSEGCCPGWSENSELSIETELVEGYVPGLSEECFLIDLYSNPYECYMEYNS